MTILTSLPFLLFAVSLATAAHVPVAPLAMPAGTAMIEALLLPTYHGFNPLVGRQDEQCQTGTFQCAGANACCDDGTYCGVWGGKLGCCPLGETCTANDDPCTYRDYDPCPMNTAFCCPTGTQCIVDSTQAVRCDDGSTVGTDTGNAGNSGTSGTGGGSAGGSAGNSGTSGTGGNSGGGSAGNSGTSGTGGTSTGGSAGNSGAGGGTTGNSGTGGAGGNAGTGGNTAVTTGTGSTNTAAVGGGGVQTTSTRVIIPTTTTQQAPGISAVPTDGSSVFQNNAHQHGSLLSINIMGAISVLVAVTMY